MVFAGASQYPLRVIQYIPNKWIFCFTPGWFAKAEKIFFLTAHLSGQVSGRDKNYPFVRSDPLYQFYIGLLFNSLTIRAKKLPVCIKYFSLTSLGAYFQIKLSFFVIRRGDNLLKCNIPDIVPLANILLLKSEPYGYITGRFLINHVKVLQGVCELPEVIQWIQD